MNKAIIDGTHGGLESKVLYKRRIACNENVMQRKFSRADCFCQS